MTQSGGERAVRATLRRPLRYSAEHASHALLPLARGGDGDGACLIEPSVRCTSLRLLLVLRTLTGR